MVQAEGQAGAASHEIRLGPEHSPPKGPGLSACPCRESGDAKKRRPYLPADKQFLVTRNGEELEVLGWAHGGLSGLVVVGAILIKAGCELVQCTHHFRNSCLLQYPA